VDVEEEEDQQRWQERAQVSLFWSPALARAPQSTTAEEAVLARGIFVVRAPLVGSYVRILEAVGTAGSGESGGRRRTRKGGPPANACAPQPKSVLVPSLGRPQSASLIVGCVFSSALLIA